jgi:hypothetical protein
LNADVVDIVVGTFHAAKGRTLTNSTQAVWEKALADLPDHSLDKGNHLAEAVAIDLVREVDELVTIRQFRQAYLARCPPMGHARHCECGGAGMIQVDPVEDRWRRCRGPLVVLPDPDSPKELAGPGRATVTELAKFASRMKAKAARSLQPGPQAPQPPAPKQRQPWQRPDEPYMADLQQRQTESEEEP